MRPVSVRDAPLPVVDSKVYRLHQRELTYEQHPLLQLFCPHTSRAAYIKTIPLAQSMKYPDAPMRAAVLRTHIWSCTHFTQTITIFPSMVLAMGLRMRMELSADMRQTQKDSASAHEEYSELTR